MVQHPRNSKWIQLNIQYQRVSTTYYFHFLFKFSDVLYTSYFSAKIFSKLILLIYHEELKIRMKFSKLLQGESIEVTVYYQKLESVEASEGSYVNSETPIKGINFILVGPKYFFTCS